MINKTSPLTLAFLIVVTFFSPQILSAENVPKTFQTEACFDDKCFKVESFSFMIEGQFEDDYRQTGEQLVKLTKLFDENSFLIIQAAMSGEGFNIVTLSTFAIDSRSLKRIDYFQLSMKDVTIRKLDTLVMGVNVHMEEMLLSTSSMPIIAPL